MKKWLIGGIGTFILIGVVGAASSPQPAANTASQSTNAQTTASTTPAAQPTPAPQPAPAPVATPAPAPASSDNLSNDNTYTNVDGNTVHSPADSTNGSVPAGATAQCADGTYSFSQHHSGTCSYHGGVAQWLN